MIAKSRVESIRIKLISHINKCSLTSYYYKQDAYFVHFDHLELCVVL